MEINSIILLQLRAKALNEAIFQLNRVQHEKQGTYPYIPCPRSLVEVNVHASPLC